MADNFDTSVLQGGNRFFDTKAGDPQFDSKNVAKQRFSFRQSNAQVHFDAKAPGQYQFLAEVTDLFFSNINSVTAVP